MSLRIVFVQAGLGAGGAEKNIAAIAQHRAELGDDVHVLSMTEPPEGMYFSYPENVTIHIMDNVVKGRKAQLWRLVYIRRMLRTLKPDLVISFLTKINVLVLAAVPGRRFPIIASERNNPKVQRKNVLWRYLNDIALTRADRIVMLTEKAKAHLPPHLRERTEVIYVPCDPELSKLYKNTGQERLVAVGRLDHQKGFDLLIEAFSEVHHVNPRATLTIFGEGKERPRLEAKVAEMKLEGVVKLPGVTSTQGGWVDAGDVFVFSSRHEGFGNALAEATSAGMPAISFDCDYGPGEIIEHGETGLLVRPVEASAMAGAITNLLSDPELQRHLSETGRRRNEKLFDPQGILRQWDEVIATTRRI